MKYPRLEAKTGMKITWIFDIPIQRQIIAYEIIYDFDRLQTEK